MGTSRLPTFYTYINEKYWSRGLLTHAIVLSLEFYTFSKKKLFPELVWEEKCPYMEIIENRLKISKNKIKYIFFIKK